MIVITEGVVSAFGALLGLVFIFAVISAFWVPILITLAVIAGIAASVAALVLLAAVIVGPAADVAEDKAFDLGGLK